MKWFGAHRSRVEKGIPKRALDLCEGQEVVWILREPLCQPLSLRRFGARVFLKTPREQSLARGTKRGLGGSRDSSIPREKRSPCHFLLFTFCIYIPLFTLLVLHAWLQVAILLVVFSTLETLA